MDDCKTPRKLNWHAESVQHFYKSPATFKFISHFKTQISNSQRLKVSHCNLGTQTPDKENKEYISTPGKKCSLSSTAKSFNIFPLANTPPSESQKRKIINPFDAALAERLHLPLICSPSLFQRPSTPQCSSSTHFEWTIEEVSSIGPANVEPHETQFHDVLDPEIEAKTQAAISSFFKEQQIVPSPVNHPLGKQRIILRESELATENSPSAIRPAKRIRDGIAQTILTLPPTLPQEIEDSLKPYFNFIQNQQQSPSIYCDKSDSLIAYHDARDASLRRKLFAVPFLTHDDTFEVEGDENEIFQSSAFSSPPPKSPEVVEETGHASQKEHSDNLFDKNSFGSLSPISKISSDSPNPKRFSSEKRFNSGHENISPIKRISPTCVSINQSKINSTSLNQEKLSDNMNGSFVNLTNSKLYRSTPDNSLHLKNSANPINFENNMSVDSSFNYKIKQLLVNNSSKLNDCKIKGISKTLLVAEDLFNQNEYDEDDMQVSQLSEKSSNTSHSSNADTPRRSKKTLSRKNLSRSFSSPVSDDDNDIFDNDCKNSNSNKSSAISNSENIEYGNMNVQAQDKEKFYRTDSGFNEMANIHDDLKFVPQLKYDEVMDNNPLENEDMSMISCSTPSKKG